MTPSTPAIGDRITFRSPTWHSGAPRLTRIVQSSDHQGRALVKAHGWDRFVVMPGEIIKTIPTVPADQMKALRTFAGTHGRCWKSTLNRLWIDGTDADEPGGDALRRYRNQFGPSALAKLKL